MKNLKILINADCSNYSINAQDRNGKHWALYLSTKKYHLSIFNSGKVDSRLSGKDIHIIKQNKNKIIKVASLIIRVIIGRYDIILNAKNSIYELILIKFLNIFHIKTKIITFAVNLVPYGERNSFYTRTSDYILFNSDYLIANSSYVAETIRKYKKIIVPVINNFHDPTLFKPISHKNKRIRVLCHGSMIPVKQPFLFANIAKELPEADFIWYGERMYYDAMKEKIKRENIDNLTLPGGLKNNELPEVLALGDVYLYPSIHEGFPNVLVEAMGCGLPVIVFNQYGPEAVVDGKTGYVVSSEYEMLRKLKYLLHNEKLIEEYGRNARLRAMEYDGRKLVHKLETIIDGC